MQILIALLRELERHYHLLLEKGSAAIAERWAAASTYAQRQAHPHCDRRRRITLPPPGVDPSGALRVRYDDGREEAWWREKWWK